MSEQPTQHSRVRRGLSADQRGEVWVEYLILIAVLGLAALAAIRGLDSAMASSAGTQGAALLAMSTTASNPSGPSDPSLLDRQPQTREAPDGHDDDEQECDGFWSCAWDTTKNVAGAAWDGVFEVGRGAWDDVVGVWDLVRNPASIVDGFKYVWEHPGDAARQLVWDDESKGMWEEGNYTGAIGRMIWNVGSNFIPGVNVARWGSKLGKLAKLRKLIPDAPDAPDVPRRRGDKDGDADGSADGDADGDGDDQDGDETAEHPSEGTDDRGDDDDRADGGDGESPAAVAERARRVRENESFDSEPVSGDRNTLDEIEREAAAGDPGKLGELDAIERRLDEGSQVTAKAPRENQTHPDGTPVTNPDLEVDGKPVEVKTRVDPLNKNYIAREISDSNTQIKNSQPTGRVGEVDIQLKGQASETLPEPAELDRMVRRNFNQNRGGSLDTVSIYDNGQLVGRWERDASGAVQRTH